jgi:excisionase family DNA binding protein
MMLTPHQAAEILSCSVRKVRQLCRDGRLRSVNIGKQHKAAWRIYADTVLDIKSSAADVRLPLRSGMQYLDAVRGKRMQNGSDMDKTCK